MSINQQFLLDGGGLADVDLAEQIGVTISAAGVVELPAAGARIDGVTARRAGAGEETQVIISGIVPIKIATAGTLAKGDYVTVDANGQFLALDTGDEAGAKLLEAPAADGDVVSALVDFSINVTGA